VSSFSRFWWIAKYFSRPTPLATGAFGWPKAMTTWFFGTFTIFCFTRAVQKADTPTRLVEWAYMQEWCIRYRLYGLFGPARKSV
jgi:hypothetical protein